VDKTSSWRAATKPTSVANVSPVTGRAAEKNPRGLYLWQFLPQVLSQQLDSLKCLG
jgi:hypothetical protein